MSRILSHTDVVKQSMAVYNQFGESKWKPYARENVKLEHKNASELFNSGIGKTLVLCAMGESLEKNIDVLKKYRDRVDILTCDKGFAPLLEHDIKPDYVMICDCNVLGAHWEKYMIHSQDVKLLATIYANPMWTKPWMGDRYFYINRDAIESEKVFLEIFGNDTRLIPASSNVSNAMLVFFTGCDENNRFNWAGYEKYVLLGYDYSWRTDGNYYAWSNPEPKRFYMTHRTALDMNGDIVHSSENLIFSAKWMSMYLQAFRQLPVVNCSGRGLLDSCRRGDLEQELSSINPDRSAIGIVKAAFESAKAANEALSRAKDNFTKAREVLSWQSATMQR